MSCAFSRRRPTVTSAAASHLLVLNAAEGRVQMLIACPASEFERTGGVSIPGCPDRNGGYVPRCAQSWHAPSQGAELLAPALRDAWQRLRISPGDIKNIAVVRGPGSFTGLRLTLATAAGLARATGALQAGLEYLPLLAASAAWRLGPLAGAGRCLWVLTHARRQLVHLQGFIMTPGQNRQKEAIPVSALGEIAVCTPEEAVQRILSFHETAASTGDGRAALPPLLLGSGLTRNRDVLAALLKTSPNGTDAVATGASGACPLFLDPDFDHPTFDAMLRIAAALSFISEDVAPYYARPADAEENLERIALSLRLDPRQARARLGELTGNVL